MFNPQIFGGITMIDPITMMVASIGMQFFNNYANSKKNTEIQKKQREFQKAAAEHDFERMRKLQAESAKLALELEAEVHKERVEDINSNYDALLENFAHSFTIQNWPLNVLPFIMKGESFGTLFNGTTQSVNMHCIFTPSNCDWFNEMFYDDIDLRLEAEMNNNWNAQSTHPIVYYGGGWNRRSLKHGVSKPNPIDLDDIGLLETHLKNIPVLVVTPYFDPWLHFRVKLWGMGKDTEAPYRIDIPHGDEVEFSKRIFSYDYNKDEVDITEDFENTTVEEFVPYLECLIGFIADKYFWSMYRITPQIPSLLLEENLKIYIQVYKDYYVSYIRNRLQEWKMTSFQDVKTCYDYIESVSSLTNKEQCEQIQNCLLHNIKSSYLLSNKSQNSPNSYSDVYKFLQSEESNINLFTWVKYEMLDNANFKDIFIDKFDLVEYLENFKEYIDKNRDRFDLDITSMYIKQLAYKKFEIHIYDVYNKRFLKVTNGFDYIIRTNRPAHFKKMKYIFKNKDCGEIVCRYARIDKMIDELKDSNTLIF